MPNTKKGVIPEKLLTRQNNHYVSNRFEVTNTSQQELSLVERYLGKVEVII